MSEPLNLNSDEPVSLDELLHERVVPASPAGISYEFLAYLVLIVLSLAFRMANLDSVPMSDIEATRALPAWHLVHAAAPGTIVPASSTVNFWLQYAGFSTLGGGELTARLPGILAGMILILMPLLFRARIGRERAFLLSLLFAISPIGIVAARNADPALWTVIFALAALWAFGRYYDTRQNSDMGLTAAFVAALVFLSGAGGLLLVLIVALALAGALWWTAWSAPQDLALENPGTNVLAKAREVAVMLPWRLCLAATVAVVFVTSTLFMFYPAGLSMAGEAVAAFVRGFWLPAQPEAPIGYPVLTMLLFDPLLIVFAMTGIVLLINRERFGFRERFFVAWFISGVVWLTIYRGGEPAYALFLVIPLAFLAVETALALFVNRPVSLFLFDDLLTEEEGSSGRFAWVKYGAGLVSMALLVMLSVHWQEIGRGLVSLPLNQTFSDAMNMLMEQPYAMFRYSAIWFVITLLFMVIGYMMAASVWGNPTTLQGLGIGAFIVMMISGVGGGWNEAVAHAAQPGGIWHTAAVPDDAMLLRKTLLEIALRNMRGFPAHVKITVVKDESTGITDNGLLAWLLRDFDSTEFVSATVEAQKDEIVIMSPADAAPNLGGTYVGQSFLMREHWTLNYLPSGDMPAWFALRRLRDLELPQDKVVLWLRQDIFNATPAGQVD